MHNPNKIPDFFETYSRRTPAWIIHHARIEVRVPQYALDDNLSWLNEFHTPEEERRAAEYLVTIPMSIMRMANLFGQGIPIHIKNRIHSVSIYRVIRRHLLDWEDAVQNQLTLNDAPADDLEDLDEFAGKLWEFARNYLSEEESDSPLISALLAKGFVSVGPDQRNMRETYQNAPSEPERPPVRDSVHDPIAKNIQLHLQRKRRR